MTRSRPPTDAERTVATVPIRVVLGEEEFLAREGIAHVLDASPGIELVVTCSDLPALRREIARSVPDVVVTDVALPPQRSDEGIRLAVELRATHPRMGVVVLGTAAEPQHTLRLFADGSYRRAFLLKERLTSAGDVARAVREVAAGGAVVDPRVVDALLRARAPTGPAPLAALSPRERQILGLVAEGHSNGVIAELLGITKRGVERHINAIFAKLDLGAAEDVSRRVRAALVFLHSSPPPPPGRFIPTG